MPAFVLHRRYQLTCRECGWHWTITRSQARLRPSRWGPEVAVGGLQVQYDEAVDNLASQVDAIEQFRVCPKCGSRSYEERPITRRRPPDPPPD